MVAAGIVPRRSMLYCQNHLFSAVQTSNVHCFGSPDRVTAARADVFPGTGCFGRCYGRCSAVSAGSGDTKPAELVSVYQNIAQVIIQAELQQAVTGSSDCPPILVMVFYNQAPGLCAVPKFPIVIGAAPAAILNAAHIIVVVYHLMQQCSANFFNGARQRSRANIDFVGAAQFGNPCIFPEGEMTVGFWG